MTATTARTAAGLVYDEVGSGAVVVLLHGFPLNRGMWRPQLAALSAQYRLIAPDLPGFGASAPSAAGHSIGGMAAAVRDLLDALNVEQAAICGLSMGGYVTLAFAVAFPERVAALILADTSARADTPQRKEDRSRRIALVQSTGMAPFAAETVPPLLAPRTAEQAPERARHYREMVEGTAVETVIAGLKAIRDRPDRVAGLPGSRMPALVIVGEHDPITPPEWSEELAAGLPDARLVIVPGAGHMTNFDAPEVFNHEALRLLQRVTRS